VTPRAPAPSPREVDAVTYKAAKMCGPDIPSPTPADLDLDLSQAYARAEAATAGPWLTWRKGSPEPEGVIGIYRIAASGPYQQHWIIAPNGACINGPEWQANWESIAAARLDLPAAIRLSEHWKTTATKLAVAVSDYEAAGSRLRERIKELESNVFSLQQIVTTHDLCHNLHGAVDAQAFADGCANEQRKHFGCAPDADEVERLQQRCWEMEDKLG